MVLNSDLHWSLPSKARLAVESSWSVMPPKALTTTIMGCLLASRSTMRLRLKILFTEPTDVPPNFITFISDVLKVYTAIPSTKGLWRCFRCKFTHYYQNPVQNGRIIAVITIIMCIVKAETTWVLWVENRMRAKSTTAALVDCRAESQ